MLKELINKNIVPCIYEHGGCRRQRGSCTLAHLGLGLIGEGEVIYEDTVQPAAGVFKRLGIKPLSIHIREGLSVINGTSAMTGIGMLNIIQAKKLLQWSIMLSAMTNELMEAYDDHYSYELNVVKHHKGQNHIASVFRDILDGSKMIRSRSEHLYNPDNIKHDVFEDKVQGVLLTALCNAGAGPCL